MDWNDPSNTDITGYQYQQRQPATLELREVRWQAPADTSSIAKWQYQLTPSGGSAGSWTDICDQTKDTTCKDRTSHRVQDSALVAGNYYSVKIRYQPDTAAKIAAPTAGVTTNSSGAVTLNWIAVAGATGYQYRTQTGTTVLATAWSDWTDAGTGTSKDVTGLTASANYQAQVRALKNNEEIVQADLLTAASQTLRSEAMRWPSAWTAMSSSGATTITHDVTTGLTDGATYEYRIRAHKGTGNAVKYSLPSSAARIALPAAFPSAPTGLKATPRAGSVALSWKNPNDTSIYKWQYSSDNGANWTDVPNSTATTASYTVPNLTDGTAYTFKVRAVNYKGNSDASEGATATPVGVPAKPANFSAVGQGNYCITNCDDDDKINRASVQLTWDDLNDSTITGWQYQQKRGAGGYGGWKSMKADLVVNPAAPLTFTPNNWNTAQRVTVKLAAKPSETVKLALSRGGTVFAPSELTFTADNWNEAQSVEVKLAAKPTASYTMRMFQTGVIYRPAYLVFSTNDASASKSVKVRLDAKPASDTTLTLTVSNAVFTPATLPFTADNWNVDQTASVSLSPDHRLNANVTFDLSDCCAYYAGSLTSYLVSDLKPSTSASDAYGYKIRAVNASGNGAESNESTTNTHERPGEPADLTATAGVNSATLTWTHPAAGAAVDKYQYQYKTTGAYGAWTNTPLTGASANVSHAVSNLTGNVAHTFRVRGVNLYNDPGPASDEITVTPTGAPGAPMSLAIETGNKTLRVSWTAPTGHVNPITGYEYRTKPTSNTDWGGWASITGSNATTTTADLTVATNGVSHDAQIRAVNADGKGAASTTVAGTPSAVPSAPAGLTAIANNGEAALTWTNPNDSTITEYEYSKDGGTTWTDVPSSGATTTSYTVTSLTDGTTYTLAIRAVNSTGNGLPTSVTATPVYLPLKPKDFTAVLASDTSATLTWTEPSPADTTITKYQYTKDNGTTWENVPCTSPCVPDTQTTYTATGLTRGNNYHFQVRAANSNGSGPPSDAVNLVTKPAKPTGFTAAPRAQSVDLAWDDPENSTITAWQMRQWTDGGSFITGTGSPQTITLEWTVPNNKKHLLSQINQFSYRANGSPSWYDARDMKVSCSPISACEVSPLNYSGNITTTLTKGNSHTFEVAGILYNPPGTWSEYWSQGVTNVWETVSADADATLYTVPSLTNDTTYNFQIRAVNATGISDWSDQASATPKAAPAAPTGLTASARDTGAVLSWTVTADSTVTGYEYQYKTAGSWDDTWTAMTGSANKTTSHAVTGLTNNTAHTFRIRAVNRYGESAASNETTATPATAPAKPTILTATPMDGAVDLTWTDPSNNTITGWQYQYKTTGNYTAWQSMDSFLALRETARTSAAIGTNQHTVEWRLPANASGVQKYQQRKRRQVALGWSEWTDIPCASPCSPATLDSYTFTGLASNARYTFEIRGVYSNPATLTAFSVRGLTNDAAHTFKIRAINPSGNGDPSDESTAATPKPAPSAPALTTATPFDAEVALAWTYPSDGAPTDRMEYSGDNGATWTVAKTEVVNSKGQIGFDSNNWNVNQSFTAKLPAAPPSDVKITFSQPGATFTPSRLTFTTQNWNTPQTVNVKLLKEPQAEPCPICPPGWTPVLPIQYVLTINDRQIWDNATSDTATGLTNSTEYTFVVRGVNAYGNGPASNAIKATPIAKPAKPTGFTAAPKHQSAILSWTDPNDDTITKWQYSQKTGNNAYGDWTDVKISVVNSEASVNFDSDKWNHYHPFTVKLPAAPAPESPNGVKITLAQPGAAFSPSSLTFTTSNWNTPQTVNVKLTKAPLPSQLVCPENYQCPPTKKRFALTLDSQHIWNNATSVTPTGLTNDTAYTFKLRAINASGNSPESDERTATPKPAPDASLPTWPQ